jgi:hypothetical protein
MSLGIGGAAFLRNLPAEDSYAVNEDVFNTETERNDVALQQVAFPGLGAGKVSIRLPANGLLANVRVGLDGTLTLTGTSPTFTPGYQWPWNVLKRVTFNANGQTSLISCEGLDLRVRRQRLYRNPDDPLVTAPSVDAKGWNTGAVVSTSPQSIALQWDVPITHDESQLIGALFAQSDQNYLALEVTPAAVTDLGTLGGTGPAMTITGNLRFTVTFYDIPLVNANGKSVVVIPNLAWLHGYLSSDAPFANVGDVRTPFIRTAGQLLAYAFYLDNGGVAFIDAKTLNEIRFSYGGNRKPRVYNPPTHLIEKNGRDYNGKTPPYVIFDFEGDNPARDLVYPKGVTELAVEVNIPTGQSLNAGSRVHFVEDTLYAGV